MTEKKVEEPKVAEEEKKVEKTSEVSNNTKEKPSSKAHEEDAEPIATNGIRPDSDFKSKDTSVDKLALMMNQIDKTVGRVNKGSLDDMVVNAFIEPFFALLDILTAYLKAKQEKLKQVAKDEKAAKKAHVEGALKSKGLSHNALASRVAYRTQRWLADSSMLPRNPDGSFKRSGLTRAQRFNYKKMLFAQKLPVIEGEGVYDFSKFTRYQKKQYAKYVMMYASQNPVFKKYVESMMEATVSNKELQHMARVGTEMNLKYRSGQLYRMRAENSRVA